MQQIEQKTLKVTKVDFAILITCSLVFGLSYSDLTHWAGTLQDVLVYDLVPLIMGCLGLVYIFLQNQEQLGMILLGITAVLDLVFGIWWIVLSIEKLGDSPDFYYTLVNIIDILFYGVIYILPGFACGWRAFEIFQKKEGIQTFDVDLVSVLSLSAVSIMLVYNYVLFDFCVFRIKFNGNFGDDLTGILGLVGLIAVTAGLYGNLKNKKEPLFLYIGYQILLWGEFLIVQVFINGNHIFSIGTGLWIFINSLIFVGISSFKAFQIHKGTSKDAYQAII